MKVAHTFGNRFRAYRRLKGGDGVDTFLGTDLAGGAEVVIKAVSTAGSLSLLHRLEHEALVLRDLDCPSIPPLLHVGREEDKLYFTMPRIAGTTLAERLAEGPLSVDDAIMVGRCLLTALAAVHEQGVLHRDLKPENVILEADGEGEPARRALLVDFGLASSRRLETSIRDLPAGTVRYISPEQAGTVQREVGPPSDLYSFGILLFECLVGHPPFQGESATDLLRQHLTAQPPDLAALGVGAPGALDAVIQHLLRKDPRDRYQSAAGVLADLDEIADAWRRGVDEPGLVVGAHDRRATLSEPAFVGRRAELVALRGALEKAAVGDGGIVLLESESGGGKTRLLEAFASEARRRGAWVLDCHLRTREVQPPFALLEGVSRELVSATGEDRHLAHRIRARLGEHAPAACAALPGIEAVLGARASDSFGPEAFGEARTLSALSVLLDALGDAERPAVLLFDDCQWGDEATLALLYQWHRRDRESGKDEPPRRVLVVASFRSEEVSTDHPLRSLSPIDLIHLKPLSSEDVRALVSSMAGEVPQEALEAVERLCEGNPFLTIAVLRGLVETGALVSDTAGWRIEPAAMGDVQTSRRAAAFLSRRIERLPSDVVQVLSVGALLGRSFDPDDVLSLSGRPAEAAMAAVSEARRRHIIWTRRDGARFAFVHDKLREDFLARTAPEERIRLHRLAGRQIEARDSDRVFALAYHFNAAGDPERALPYALEAAQQARSRHALAIAERHYRIAQEGARDLPTRRRVAEALGDVLMLRGCYGPAAEQFETARRLATKPIDRARIAGRLGELELKRGDAAAAATSIQQALALLGRPIPRSQFGLVFGLLRELVVQLSHSWTRRRDGAGRPREAVNDDATTEQGEALEDSTIAERVRDDLLAVHLYSQLSYAWYFLRGPLPTLWAHLLALNTAERYPATRELGHAYSEHVAALSIVPSLRTRAVKYADRAREIVTGLGDLWGQAKLLHLECLGLYAASNFSDCLAKAAEAERLLSVTGDRWASNNASLHRALCLLKAGELRRSTDLHQQVFHLAMELGDYINAALCLTGWSVAAEGQVPLQLLEREITEPREDVQIRESMLHARGIQLLANRKAGRAAEAFEQAIGLFESAGSKNSYTCEVYPWLATALRRAAGSLPSYATDRRRALLRRARAAARKGLRLSRSFRNSLPHALRERGILSAVAGRPRRARRHLDESLAVAEEQGARYESVRTLLARGRIGLELGWPKAAEQLRVATSSLEKMGATVDLDFGARLVDDEAPPVTLSLVDRFSTVLDVGRQIAAALTRREIIAAVQHGALALLRPERCLVLEVAPGGDLEGTRVAAGDADGGYSRDLVTQALRSDRPMVYADVAELDASRSVVLAGVRSALCVPIPAGGSTSVCLYLTHRQIGALFGNEEERLARYIATIAGAALENAQHLAEVEALSRSLEQRAEEARRSAAELAQLNAETELRKTLLECQGEAAIDGILVVSEAGRILYSNRRFREMWGIPDEVLVSRSDESALRVARERLEEPGAFLARVAHLYAHPDERSHEELRLRDGRTFERHSAPVRSAEGAHYGRVWFFRDITQRKRAEQRIRSLSEAVVAGQEDERRRLSRVLHDGAQQQITAALLRLEEIARRPRERLAARLDQVADLLGKTLGDLRRLSHDLRPAALDRLGLREALHDLSQELASERLSIECVADRGGDPQDAPEVAVAAFRIAQEALTNVVRHSRARHARVSLTVVEGSLALEIEDDGVGFDASTLDDAAGIGLIGMRERAVWLGGALEIDSAPGKGTRILASLPLAGGSE